MPALPGFKSRPSLLLHDLQNVEHTETDGYKYIVGSQKIGPIALYGTPGAGKTRTIFEYLSHNYGFYLSAGADPMNNPGSEDVSFLIEHCATLMKPVSDNHSSEANLVAVQKWLKVLLCVRKEVLADQCGSIIIKSKRRPELLRMAFASAVSKRTHRT